MTVPLALRTAAATTVVLLLAGCGGEVTIGDSTTSVSPPTPSGSTSTDDAVGEATVTASPALNPEPSAVGAAGVLQLHLPLGWAPVAGSDMASASDTALLQGGHRVTSVPAEGRTSEEWIELLLTGGTDLFTEPEGMELKDQVTTTSGLTLFHLVQRYSENRAQVFGTVVGDTLHLLRFGLDGSPEAVEVARASASTLEVLS